MDHAAPEKSVLWEVGNTIEEIMTQHARATPRLLDAIASLQDTLDATRVAYNIMIAERDAKRQLLVAAEGRLAEVQRVVQRYIVVQEPVVASDGYTYERAVIRQYLNDCEEGEANAYSQQTKEVLTNVLVPNQSLRKLVDLLRTVKPQEVPNSTPRSAILPFRNGNGNTMNWGEDDDSEEVAQDKKAIHASELEAAFSKPEAKKAEAAHPPKAESAKEALLRGGSNTNASASSNTRSNVSSKAQDNGARLHPCLRVYGFCNFKDDCTFARYPYDACLNNIKGKCRFGTGCKEMHVNPNDAKYHNPRNNNNATGGGNRTSK